MSAAPSTTAATSTLSALVRRVLVSQHNKPIRMNALWEELRKVDPSSLAAVTKSHFKKRVVAGMFHREEVRLALRCAARARARRRRGGGDGGSGISSPAAPLRTLLPR